MTHSHSPGPWELEHFRNEDGSKSITINGQGPHGAWLADIQAGVVNGKPADVTEKHLANARLIAAAPELLEALRRALDIMEELPYPQGADAMRQARAAIAKARGDA